MIEVKALSRHFGEVKAVRQISFQIPDGVICGFIGPNGAGKTTTMRILVTLDMPTEGEAYINGYSVTTNPAKVRREIGYMPDYYGTYPDLIAEEYLDFFARAYGIPRSTRATRIRKITDFTELGPLLKRPVEGLSKGQKQRLGLARTLLPDPSVLVLDEPAAGLDPRARLELRELLKILAEQGKAIFVSSHILNELGDLIDRVVIIEHGKICFSGSLDDLHQGDQPGIEYTLELASNTQEARRFLLEQASVLAVEGTEEKLYLRLDETQEPVEETLARLMGAGIRLRQFYRRQNRLEDAFMAVTGQENNPHG